MSKIIPILFLSLFTACCQTNHIESVEIIKSFDLKKLPKTSEVMVSDLGFNDIEYIPLETNENSLIKAINELKFGKQFILVKCGNSILKFSNDGSYLTRIGTIGRGPDEFTDAMDFDIDPKNLDIYVVSAWQKKFNVYSENGTFKRTFSCPGNTTNFRIINDEILCYNMNTMGNVVTSYNYINKEGHNIRSFPNQYLWNYNRNGMYVYIYENLFFLFNGQLFLKQVYSDTVYVFEKADFKPWVVIEAGQRLITTDARSNFNPEYLAENFYTPFSLFRFGDYIYYEFGIGRSVIYSFIGSIKDNFQTFINAGQGLINNLDGGPAIRPKTIKDENNVITWITALDLKKHVASETFIKSTPKYPEKKKELEKLAASLKETDNPVLVLVRLKK